MDDIEKIFSQLGLALEDGNPEWDFHVNEDGVLCSDGEKSIAAEVARPDYRTIVIDNPDGIGQQRFDPNDPLFEQQVAEHCRSCGLNLREDWMG